MDLSLLPFSWSSFRTYNGMGFVKKSREDKVYLEKGLGFVYNPEGFLVKRIAIGSPQFKEYIRKGYRYNGNVRLVPRVLIVLDKREETEIEPIEKVTESSEQRVAPQLAMRTAQRSEATNPKKYQTLDEMMDDYRCTSKEANMRCMSGSYKGGNFKVTDLTQFRSLYLNAFRKNQVLYLVELIGERFKLFVELDDVPIELKSWVEYSIRSLVKKLYGKKIRVYSLTNDKNPRNHHLHIPDIIIDKASYRVFLDRLETVASNRFPELKEEKSKQNKNLIDSPVGLRLPGCWKIRRAKDGSKTQTPGRYLYTGGILNSWVLETFCILTDQPLTTLKDESLRGQPVRSETVLTDESRTEIFACLTEEEKRCFKLGKKNKAFYRLSRIDSGMCRICNRVHDSDNAYIFVSPIGNVYLGCFREKGKKELIGTVKTE